MGNSYTLFIAKNSGLGIILLMADWPSVRVSYFWNNF